MKKILLAVFILFTALNIFSQSQFITKKDSVLVETGSGVLLSASLNGYYENITIALLPDNASRIDSITAFVSCDDTSGVYSQVRMKNCLTGEEITGITQSDLTDGEPRMFEVITPAPIIIMFKYVADGDLDLSYYFKAIRK